MREFRSDQVPVVTPKNQGAAATRNAAYSLSKGDRVQFLDADDLMGPQKIARQMEAGNDSPMWVEQSARTVMTQGAQAHAFWWLALRLPCLAPIVFRN